MSKAKVFSVEELKAVVFDPACEMLPDMKSVEFDDLCQSIHEHGQREPFKFYKNGEGIVTVIVGRHRVKAGIFLGRPMEGIEVDDSDPKELAKLVYDMDLMRRNLSAGQRAAIAADMKATFEAAAKARKKAGKKAATAK